MDHELLYQPAADGIDKDPAFAHLGIAPMGVKDWFTPFNDGRYVHPYAPNEDEKSRRWGSPIDHLPDHLAWIWHESLQEV
jgi:hypothetical protein